MARHVVAFVRQHESQALVVLAGRFFVGLCKGDASALPALPQGDAWQDTTVQLPAWLEGEVLENLLTGERFTVGADALALSAALRHVPWAAFVVVRAAS
jgi:(1->4)-alpha-D-glucan 1-alpha-D-glucosylmutase